MTEPTVVVVGSANLDLVAQVERLAGPGETVLGSSFAQFPGGKGLNQAVAAARSGATTAFVGAVGADEAGGVLCDVMAAEGIDLGDLRVLPDRPTGRAMIMVDSAGENSIVVIPGANQDAEITRLDDGTVVVLAQLEIPIATVQRSFELARRLGAITVLNPAPAQPLPESLLALCDLVIPNEHELDVAGGIDHLRAAGVAAVVVTRGSRGAEIHRAEGRLHQPPFLVTAVDTTAAGDSFCGAMAARLAAGDTLDEAVRWGAAAGALAATVRGAVPSIPSTASIRAVLEGSERRAGE